MTRVAFGEELQVNWVSLIADFMLAGMVFGPPVAPFLAASGYLERLRTSFISWVIMYVRNQLWG